MTFEVDNTTKELLEQLQETVSGPLQDQTDKITEIIERLDGKIDGCASAISMAELQNGLKDNNDNQNKINSKLETILENQIGKEDFKSLSEEAGKNKQVLLDKNEQSWKACAAQLEKDTGSLQQEIKQLLSAETFNTKSQEFESRVREIQENVIRQEVQPLVQNIQEIKSMIQALEGCIAESKEKQEKIYSFLQMPWYKRIFTSLKETENENCD